MVTTTALHADHYWCIVVITTALHANLYCVVLKKVDSRTGKLGYGFTVLRDNYSDRLHRARVFTPINDTPECRKQLSECRMMQ